MIVNELDYRTQSQMYDDELRYRKIDPHYGDQSADDSVITPQQLTVLNDLIEMAQKEHVMDKLADRSIKNFVMEVYKVDKLEEIKQGMYRERVVPFVLLMFPYLWMTIPEKEAALVEKERDKLFIAELNIFHKKSGLSKFIARLIGNIPTI